VNLIDDNLLSDKIEINVHMLSVLMLNEVGGEVHDADIVAVDKCALKMRTLELMEQLVQPGGLSYAIGDDMVLNLHAGPGDDRMLFGQPGHQVVPKNTA
jgi:hypothetical protein